jgi:hypothetical protein
MTLPEHLHFVRIPMAAGDRVVSLDFQSVGTIVHRHVDDEEVEDIYVLQTDCGQTLIRPEGDLRLVV